jgi:hypothetical protein
MDNQKDDRDVQSQMNKGKQSRRERKRERRELQEKMKGSASKEHSQETPGDHRKLPIPE